MKLFLGVLLLATVICGFARAGILDNQAWQPEIGSLDEGEEVNPSFVFNPPQIEPDDPELLLSAAIRHLNQYEGTSADKAAKFKPLADKTGLSVDFVERNPDIEPKYVSPHSVEALKASPILAKYFSDESNAAVAHDDIFIFFILSALIGGVGTAAVMLGLGAYFKKSPKLPPEISRFLWMFKNPREVRDSLNALTSLRPKFESEGLWGSLATNNIFIDVRSMIVREKEKTVYSVSVNKWNPSDLALLLISKSSSNALLCGRYHIYRGALADEGYQYMRIFRKSIGELVKSGFITEEEAKADLVQIRENIKDVG